MLALLKLNYRKNIYKKYVQVLYNKFSNALLLSNKYTKDFNKKDFFSDYNNIGVSKVDRGDYLRFTTKMIEYRDMFDDQFDDILEASDEAIKDIEKKEKDELID